MLTGVQRTSRNSHATQQVAPQSRRANRGPQQHSQSKTITWICGNSVFRPQKGHNSFLCVINIMSHFNFLEKVLTSYFSNCKQCVIFSGVKLSHLKFPVAVHQRSVPEHDLYFDTLMRYFMSA